MNTENNAMGVKLRNAEVGKAECSVVLVAQSDKDDVLASRLLNEVLHIEPVTLTDEREEIDGHDVNLRRGYVRGVRLALRPAPAVENKKKATPKKAQDG